MKCILVASGNDAAVAMAEHIAGTEEEFVSRMNQKAEETGDGKYAFHGLLRSHGFRGALYNAERHCSDVTGAHHKISGGF